MKYELSIFKPGLNGFTKKGEPIGFEPEHFKIEAASHTHAFHLARAQYEETGLGSQGHFNVSVAS